jgi:mannose-6-phosphate isomerase-like protein (cupin superfamily)
MKKPPALLVTLESAKADPALRRRGRGARKILVTEAYPGEQEAAESIWRPPGGPGKCLVQVMRDTEVASFTERAPQDRHYHKIATEIYIVLEGSMTIEVEGDDYNLGAGDMIVVNPGAAHQVKPGRSKFICRVVAVNCGGPADKYLAGE